MAGRIQHILIIGAESLQSGESDSMLLKRYLRCARQSPFAEM
jgi:hypothetical protein